MQRPRTDRLNDHLKVCKAQPRENISPGEMSSQVITVEDEVAEEEGEDEITSVMAAEPSAKQSSMFVPIVASPRPTSASSAVSGETLNPLKRRHSSTPSSSATRSPSSSLGLLGAAGYFIQTTAADKVRIRSRWADFFLKNRLSFRLADDPAFRAALEATRPGINGENGMKPLLTRKALSGTLLDEVEARCKKNLSSIVMGKNAVLSQDGWSDAHQEPVIAASLHCEGKTYPLDFETTGAETKSATFCAQLAKQSTEKAEEQYGCVIIGFVSDSENKMVKLRRELAEWRNLMVYGCSAHALNLVESTATPEAIMGPIVTISKFFINHHKPAAVLKELGGLIPQLPNITRWTSQRATLATFIHNYERYGRIVDDERVTIPDSIRDLINNRRFLSEAKSMLTQLDLVATVLNDFQDDTKNLSDCVRGWLSLISNDNISQDVREAIQLRFRKTVTTWHTLAYMLDNRDHTGWPQLPSDLAEQARVAIMEMGDEAIHAMAAYEMKDESVYSKLAFSPTIKERMEPAKYWNYIARVTTAAEPKKFADMMAKVFALPPSSAGIERIFSTAGLVQSKSRNRLGVKKVGRLVSVSRLLSMNDKDKGSQVNQEGLEEEFLDE